MTTVAEVLHGLGYTATEEEVALSLQELLLPAQDSAGVDLSAADDAFLQRFSGVQAATPESLAALDARSAARAAAERAGAMSRTEVAALLGVDVTRVSHQSAAGDLYSYKLGRRRPSYPDWQFSGQSGLPHLREVMAALPAGTHPVTVRAFMTTRDSALRHEDVFVSPRDWLLGGGDVTAVLGLAGTLGEQM